MIAPTRQVAVLSLLTIGASTLVFGLVLAHFVEQGLLDREWTSTGALLRAAGRAHLVPGDFVPGPEARPPETIGRFEEFARQARMLPEVLRLVAYDGAGRAFWTDAERRGSLHGPTPRVRAALAGQSVAALEPGAPTGQERVELYVPVTFPGEGRVAGVVEAYVDASRVLASVRRARLILRTLALASGAFLHVTLYGIVWRASRTLRGQHQALARRAEELARANQDLQAVQRELAAAERLAAIGEVAAAVAHGLGDPLPSIRATAQLALLDAPEGALRERLAAVVAETDRLRDRMRALLDLGRTVEARRTPTALDAAVRHALAGVESRAAAQDVRIEIAVPADLPKVRVDSASFEEALLCLVGNALDAMPGGGALRLAATSGKVAGSRLPEGGPPGAWVVLQIEDTGPGMSEPVLARAFEPFFTTKPRGTGLGLAVARKLLEASGARLALASGPGGTRASIDLPVDPAPEA